MRRLARVATLLVVEVFLTPFLTFWGIPDSRTQDHRHKPIRVKRRLSQDVLGRPLHPDSQQAAQRVGTRLRAEGMKVRDQVVQGIILGIAMFVGIGLLGQGLRAPATWKQAAFIGAFAATLIIVLTGIRWRLGIVLRGDAKEVRAAWLAEGCCAACGYDLSGIAEAREADGCTVCPECGAAWDVR